jgi:hypothetical protein
VRQERRLCSIAWKSESCTSHFAIWLPKKTDCSALSTESGDDYLYPKAFFRPVALPLAIKKAIVAAA